MAQPSERLAALAATLMAAFVLHGCEFQMPRHTVGNWEAQKSYMLDFQYIPAGKNESEAVLNSCEQEDMPVKCSGHGECKEWYTDVTGPRPAHVLSFCKCDTYWADPECRTQRKSQIIAFLLSALFGMIGVDQFYLGFWLCGVLKLVTGGGFGLWYVYDIVRIGSTAVYTEDNYKLANDLNHFAFVLLTVFLMGVLGFAISIRSIQHHRAVKARELIILQAEGPATGPPAHMGPGQYTYGGYSGYGSTLGAA